MGHGFSKGVGPLAARGTEIYGGASDILSVVGADWSGVIAPYRKIFESAVARGYQALLLTHDGVLGIYLENELQLRVQLGADRLRAGQWEESVAKLFAQVGLLNEVMPKSGIEVGPQELRKALIKIFDISNDSELHCAVHSFPGATQCLVSLNEQLLASIVFNPVHKFLLEFRLDPMPLLLLEDGRGAGQKRQSHPLGDNITDAAPGLLRLAQQEDCRALVVIDGTETFGSQLRRTVLRLLPHLADLGYSDLVIDIPENDNSALDKALMRSNPLEYYLGRDSTTTSDISPEWTSLLSLAHSLNLRVCGGARQLAKSEIFQSLGVGDSLARPIIWLPYQKALLASQWLELLHANFGPGSGVCIAPFRASQLEEHTSIDSREISQPILVPLGEVLQKGLEENKLAELAGKSMTQDTYLFVSKDSILPTPQ